MTKAPAGITRLEIPAKRTFGYLARIKRGGTVRQAFFADRKLGGKRKAKAAARACYEEFLAHAAPANTSHKNLLTRRNTSGKVGVRVAFRAGRPGSEREFGFWTAFWTGERGRRHTVSFSWDRFGEDDAYRLACLARDHATADRRRIFALFRQLTGKILPPPRA